MSETEMHETIRDLYEGILDPDAWQRSLAALCRTSGSAHASLVVLDTVRERVLINQVVNPMPEAVAAYNAHYQALDPTLAFTHKMSVGGWYIDSRELGEEAMRRLPFYGEFFRDFNMSSQMACLVERQPHYEIFLSLQRPAGRAVYSPDDARALDWAIPHVRHAIALRDRTHAFSALAHVSAELLERVPFGVIVFADDGKPLLSNRAGEAWIRRLVPAALSGAGETMAGGGKSGDGWQFSRPFADVLRAAVDPVNAQPAQAVHATGANGGQAQLVVLPMPPAHHLSPDWQRPTVLVAVHEAGGTPFAVPALLRELYGLTPAETRLATLMTTGIGLPEACAQLIIRRETGRTQLKSIFTKTGTGTQAQLAHLLTRLAAVPSSP